MKVSEKYFLVFLNSLFDLFKVKKCTKMHEIYLWHSYEVKVNSNIMKVLFVFFHTVGPYTVS